MVSARVSTPRPLIIAALAASLILNAGLAIRYRQLLAKYQLERVLSRLPQRGLQYPEFQAVGADGDTVWIGSNDRGHRQLIFIVSKTCPYCVQTIPFWKQLLEDLTAAAPGRFEAFAIALDTVPVTQRYLDSAGLRVKVVGFPDRRNTLLARATNTPQTLVLDDDGWVRFARVGLVVDGPVRDTIRRAITAIVPGDTLNAVRNSPSRRRTP